MKKFALLSLLLLPGMALAKPKPSHKTAMSVAQVRRIIEANETRYGQAMKEGDVATYTSLFAPDATVLRGNFVMKGRDNLAQAFKKGPHFRSVVFVIQKVDVSGDLAYEVGGFTVTLMTGKVNTGNYVEIWKHQPDGSWKIQVEATVPHMDMPKPPKPSH